MDKVTKISGGVKFEGEFLGQPYTRAYTNKKADDMRRSVKVDQKPRFTRGQNDGNRI